MSFEASLAATAIGSFPHTNPNDACDLILANFPRVPIWPQLPATSLKEQMEIQYSEGMPCIVIDEQKERMYFDTSGDPTAALETFYRNYLEDTMDYFAISEAFSRGIYAMEKRLQNMDLADIEYFKMHVTGPVSFGLTVVDENKRAIYYNDMFRDVVVKCLAMKARWQLRKFKSFCDKQICFIDEPILSAFGSSTYVSVKREDVISQIAEVVEAIHKEGGLAGIHCCGNTDWTIPIDSGIDVLNFDAYDYGDTIGLYPERVKDFVENDGVMAWGIVPTSEAVEKETVDSLVNRFEAHVNSLAAKGINKTKIIKNALITASCGTGSVPLERSELIARTVKAASDALRDRHL